MRQKQPNHSHNQEPLAYDMASNYNIQNTIGAQDTGYIDEEDLLQLLEKLFPIIDYPDFEGSQEDRFKIRVRGCHPLAANSQAADKWLQVREDQYTFWTPGKVDRVSPSNACICGMPLAAKSATLYNGL